MGFVFNEGWSCSPFPGQGSCTTWRETCFDGVCAGVAERCEYHPEAPPDCMEIRYTRPHEIPDEGPLVCDSTRVGPDFSCGSGWAGPFSPLGDVPYPEYRHSRVMPQPGPPRAPKTQTAWEDAQRAADSGQYKWIPGPSGFVPEWFRERKPLDLPPAAPESPRPVVWPTGPYVFNFADRHSIVPGSRVRAKVYPGLAAIRPVVGISERFRVPTAAPSELFFGRGGGLELVVGKKPAPTGLFGQTDDTQPFQLSGEPVSINAEFIAGANSYVVAFGVDSDIFLCKSAAVYGAVRAAFKGAHGIHLGAALDVDTSIYATNVGLSGSLRFNVSPRVVIELGGVISTETVGASAAVEIVLSGILSARIGVDADTAEGLAGNIKIELAVPLA